MEFSFKDLFRIIKKNLVFVIIVAVIAGAASFLITKVFIPKTYTATVKLYVNSNYNGKTSYDDLTSFNYAQKMVGTYMELLNTERFRAAVADKLGNKYTPSELKSMVSFEEVADTEVFKATVVCSDPKETKRIADAVAVAAPETINNILSTSSVASSDSADKKADAQTEPKTELKVVDEAQTPKEPTSPSTTRNVIIAFFGGLIIALVVSVLRDYFDVKIKYNEEMTMVCGVPVLAAIPEFKNDKAFKDKKSRNAKGE